MSKKIKLIVDLSDLHCGSSKALLPPGFVTLEDQPVPQNPIQRWLWPCWLRTQAFIGEVAGDDPFALVINGDIIEGVHHGTKEIISPEVADHRDAAVEVLAPLVKRAAKFFIVRGTECHVNNSEHSIGAQLGAVKNPESKLHVFDRLTLEIMGVRCVFRHHIGTTTRRGLAGTQLSMNLAEEQVEAANNGEPIPRVLCCAHRHKPGAYRDDNGLCVVTPAWQVLTRFGHKVVSQARCKPGVIILDWRNCHEGDLPHVHEKYFQARQPVAIKL
jgi:hypothetical protein